MPELADYFLRGIQLEAQQEAQDLEAQVRRNQLQDVMEERVARKQRTSPEYARAYDLFINPDTPASDLGKYAPIIGPWDLDDANKQRGENLEIVLRNELGIEKLVQQQAGQLARLQETLDSREEIAGNREQGLMDRAGATDDRVRDLAADAAETKLEIANLKTESSKKKFTVDEAHDLISRHKFKLDFKDLSDAGKAKPRLGDLSAGDAVAAVTQAATDLLRYQDEDMDRGAALAKALAGIEVTEPVKKRGRRDTPGKVEYKSGEEPPQKAAAPGIDEQVEAGVARAVAAGTPDTPALRAALRKRAIALGGK